MVRRSQFIDIAWHFVEVGRWSGAAAMAKLPLAADFAGSFTRR
jgi:hypothetical protein